MSDVEYAYRGENRIICACQKVDIEEIVERANSTPPAENQSLEDYQADVKFNLFLCAGCETCAPTVDAITKNIFDKKENIMDDVSVENADTQ